ncbi:NADPH-dependent FMN reductase [Dactylosporangium sp. NPDC051541]|uniref:NADPH-dependent FMN reductase n=1 Tax=Dactylosporangium sp. NPDC051541 TaxID=3363977 RepID=UPI00378A4C0D
MKVLAIDGSPTGPGRTAAVLSAVLAGAAEAGAETGLVSLGEDPDIAAADAYVLGSPVHRASFATPLKAFLDRLPRGMWGETEHPLTGKAVAIVLTGASWQHFLALNDLRSVLAGFFAAHVLPPGLYVPGDGFDQAKQPTEAFATLAHGQGVALVDLARAVAASPALSSVRPQA